MKVRAVRETSRGVVWDLSVSGHHSFALENGVIVHNCDTRCMGKTCGVCSAEDLRIRRGYIQAASDEIRVDLNEVQLVDDRKVVEKVRIELVKHESKRFVMNDHWRYAVRRALRKAGIHFAKRSVRFASDSIKYRDWTCGTDYVEVGLSERMSETDIEQALQDVEDELSGISVGQFSMYPSSVESIERSVAESMFVLEVEKTPEEVRSALDRWDKSENIPMVLREQLWQVGMVREEVNAKDFVPNVWAVRDGHRVQLRMMVKGKASPYDVYAALFGERSWVDAAKYPAIRIGAFQESDASEIDFFRPVCESCEYPIPISVIGVPFDAEFCPKCKDTEKQLELEAV